MSREELPQLAKSAPESAKLLMGKIIRYDRTVLKTLPKNIDFINKSVASFVDESIRNNRNIVFHGIAMTMNKFTNKEGYNITKLLWRGVGEDGRTMVLIVNGTHQTIYVRKRDNQTDSEFKTWFNQYMEQQKWQCVRPCTFVHRKRSVYYEKDPCIYARVQFNTFSNSSQQYKIMAELEEYGHKCAGNTYSKLKAHLQMVQEHKNIVPSQPIYFKWKVRGPGDYKNCLNVDNIETFIVDIGNIEPIKKFERKTMEYPRYMTYSMDIETESVEFGKATDVDRDDTSTNVIGVSVCIDKEIVFQFGLTTYKKVLPIQNALIIQCADQYEMIMLYAKIQRRIMPEFVVGYNTDNFDWLFIKNKVAKKQDTEKFLNLMNIVVSNLTWRNDKSYKKGEKYDDFVWDQHQYYKSSNPKSRFKISATDGKSASFPLMPSFINCDMMLQLRRQHPKAPKNGLNDFLKEYGLPAKYGMPYERMHKIARDEADGCETDEHVADCSDMILYCIHDTLGVIDLCEKSELIDYAMMMASITNMTYRETVMNPPATVAMDALVISMAHQGYLTGKEKKLDSHNPGAHVFHPVRQLYIPKLSIAERRQQDKRWQIVSDDDVAEMYAVVSGEKNIPNISTEANKLFREFLDEPNKNPLAPQDFGSMYPHIMLEENLSSELAIMPSDRHKFANLELREKKFADGSHMFFVKQEGSYNDRGLIPAEQFKMYRFRKETRAEQKVILARTDIDKNEKDFLWKKLEAKQLAFKVIMNSYYGKMGENYDDENTSVAIPIIASATAYGGQERLHYMAKVIEDNGWKVMYGDTDSCYPMVPDKYLDHLHRAYYSGKMSKFDYVREVVEESKKRALELCKTINTSLGKKYPFMFVESEGVLYPAILIRKKKYCGIKHEKKFMIASDGNLIDGGHYFQKSLGEQKTMLSAFVQMLSRSLYSSLLNIFNTKSFADLVRDIIRDTFSKAQNGELDDNMFIKTATLRTGKSNLQIIHFYECLEKRGQAKPSLDTKFQYVYVRRDNEEFSLTGKKKELGMSGYMELYDTFAANRTAFQLNFGIYLSKDATSELGQFVCADKNFVIVCPTDPERGENETMEQGKKMIKQICGEVAGRIPTNVRKPIYTKLYKKISHILGADKLLSDCGEKCRAMIEENSKIDGVRMANTLFREISGAKVSTLHQHKREAIKRKKIIEDANRSMRSQLICELDAMCRAVDGRSAVIDNKIVKIIDSARERLELNKVILSEADYKNADKKMNDVLANMNDVLGEVDDICGADPGENYLDLVAKIVFLDKQVVAQQELVELINITISQRANIGCAVRDTKKHFENADEFIENEQHKKIVIDSDKKLDALRDGAD